MNVLLPWVVLNTLQAGALLALAATFGADALRRKDRMMGWLFLSCLSIGLRHSVLIFQDVQLMPMDLAERLQALLAACGFSAGSITFWIAFRSYFRFRLPVYLGVFLVACLTRCLFLPLGTPFEKGFHVLLLLSYPVIYTMILMVIRKSFLARDPISRRLMGGFLLAMLPLLVEILVQLIFEIRVPISGMSTMFLSISMGVSWFWVINHGFEQKVRLLEQKAAAWRSLVPGATWSTEETSPLMESLFGDRWAQHLQDRVVGHDGRTYLLHRVPLHPGELGWLEAGKDLEQIQEQFLQGWRMALGMDSPEEFQQIRRWMEAWGAEVEAWGTVPPREGPFPSLILWGREPSILSVWREYDLVRRRCRWVQIGGVAIEGPHVRLDSPASEAALRQALEKLLVVN
jgi:hypothetical protein